MSEPICRYLSLVCNYKYIFFYYINNILISFSERELMSFCLANTCILIYEYLDICTGKQDKNTDAYCIINIITQCLNSYPTVLFIHSTVFTDYHMLFNNFLVRASPVPLCVMERAQCGQMWDIHQHPKQQGDISVSLQTRLVHLHVKYVLKLVVHWQREEQIGVGGCNHRVTAHFTGLSSVMMRCYKSFPYCIILHNSSQLITFVLIKMLALTCFRNNKDL